MAQTPPIATSETTPPSEPPAFELAQRIETVVKGLVEFIARFVSTLVIVGLRPRRAAESLADGSSNARLSRPYTFLALAVFTSTTIAQIGIVWWMFEFETFNPFGSSPSTGWGIPPRPSFAELVSVPSVFELLSVSLPLILVIYLASSGLTGLLGRGSRRRRTAVVQAACYAAGFQMVLISVGMSIAAVVYSVGVDKRILNTVAAYGIKKDDFPFFFQVFGTPAWVLASSFWAAIVLFFFFGRVLPELRERLPWTPLAHAVSFASAVIFAASALLVTGGVAYFLADREYDANYLPRKILPLQVAASSIEDSTLRVVLIVENGLRRVLAIKRDNVIILYSFSMGEPDDSETAKITAWGRGSAPVLLLGPGEREWLTLEGPIKPELTKRLCSGDTPDKPVRFYLVFEVMDSATTRRIRSKVDISSAPSCRATGSPPATSGAPGLGSPSASSSRS